MKKSLIFSLFLGIMPAISGMTAAAQISMPDNVEPMVYEFTDTHELVYVAVDGDFIYFQGLSTLYPWFTVRGNYDRNKGKVSIPQMQLIENYGGYDVYTKYMMFDFDTYDFYWAPLNFEYVMNVNLQTGRIEADKNDAYHFFGMAVDTDGEGDWQFVDRRQYVRLKLYVDYTGVPQNPTDLELEKYDGDDFTSFSFTIPDTTTNGNPISVYDVYYTLYVNGAPYPLVPDEEKERYLGLWGETLEIPAYADNGIDLISNGTGHMVGLYLDDIQSVGVQVIYKYGDEITMSEVVMLDVASVKSITSAEVVSVEYFKLDGTRVANPDKGLYIKKNSYSDGTTKTEKIIL